MKNIQNTIEKKHSQTDYLSKVLNVFEHPNFEKRFQSYSYGQMSVRYLVVATKIVEDDDDNHISYKSLLEKSELDINSCLQFLLDYYTQLLKNQVIFYLFIYFLL